MKAKKITKKVEKLIAEKGLDIGDEILIVAYDSKDKSLGRLHVYNENAEERNEILAMVCKALKI